jgi:hypothetical protein
MLRDDRLSRSSLLFENDLFRKPASAIDPGFENPSAGQAFPHDAAGEREWNE